MTAEQNETLRHSTLEALAIRHPAAVTELQLRRVIAKEIDFTFEGQALDSALEFLKGDKLAQFELDGLGTTKYWSATTEGVKYFERNFR